MHFESSYLVARAAEPPTQGCFGVRVYLTRAVCAGNPERQITAVGELRSDGFTGAALGQGMESMPELEDNHTETRGKELGPSTENKQPQAQQYDRFERLEHQDGEGGVFILRPATEGENSHKALANTTNLGKIVGKDPQSVEWGRDNSDKFYSLTEESDLSSGDHSLGGSEDSETSETEDKTSSNEPTVQQLRRHRKSVKTRSCSQGSPRNPPSTGSRTLKWDYSGIGLADSSSITNQGPANGNKETDIGPPTYSPSAIGAEAGMLQSIYSSIKELQTETRIESRRARIATKRLQGTVRKVAKSCTEIETKLSSMEERIVAVEEDVVNLKEQNTMRDEQLTDGKLNVVASAVRAFRIFLFSCMHSRATRTRLFFGVLVFLTRAVSARNPERQVTAVGELRSDGFISTALG
ncbi:hypothetical protein NDU88_004303 [Pleurodeles waltl]|uniref:Uncharacterized protein n=1 Tax=Pleurodeles waltl TaxID=8319 RepID=A0AAV7RHR7_PLEWA|nr:hypothetical protein NDU88_004303 [Pleurodeles waltl]